MRVCCVLSCDAAFFHQAVASIGTLRQAQRALRNSNLDIAFVAIDLDGTQFKWLQDAGIRVHARLADFPRFRDAPDHARALTCRPYLPLIWPGYDGFVWVDSDVRFLSHQGLEYYLAALNDPDASIVAAQESEPAYCVHTDPEKARSYHAARVQRVYQVYGAEVVGYCQYFTPFNAGLFAARADSPIWTRYRRNLAKALTVPFDGMLEQDALNVSMLEVGNWRRAPSVMNWLCSLRMPVRVDDGTWRHPDDLHRQVCVAHLTNSTAPIVLPEGPGTYYDLYRARGLTA